MWTRAEIKEKAKINLKKYYWAAFAISLVFVLISSFGSGSSYRIGSSGDTASGTEITLPSPMEGMVEEIPGGIAGNVGGIIGNTPIGGGLTGLRWGGLLFGLVAGVMIVMAIIGIILSVFIVPVMEIGKNRFYMESRLTGQGAGIGKLLWGFSNGYLNIVLTRFLMGLFVTLGTMLCVIPGIYLQYCYRLVPYILAENPEMRPMDALRLSKKMMDGQKLSVFVLDLSLIGWSLLGILACGIGTFFVQPYFDAIYAELYAELRQPYAGSLNGFGYPDVMPAGSCEGGFSGQFYQMGSEPEPVTPEPEFRDMDVSRSEGGPGRGYYLNGEFHSYTDTDQTDRK